MMPSNDPEYQRVYKQRHYAANKQRYIDQARARRTALKLEIWEIKRTPCVDCGVQYEPWIMQFDHREGEVKNGVVAKLVNEYKRKKVFEEIAKCDIVCANCHADRTYQRLVGVSG